MSCVYLDRLSQGKSACLLPSGQTLYTHIESHGNRSLRSLPECVHNASDPLRIQRVRLGIRLRERNRTRRPRIVGPPIRIWPSDTAPRVDPRRDRRRLPPSMPQLDADLLALGMRKLHNGREARGVFGAPYPGVFRADAAFWEDGGAFGKGESWAARENAADLRVIFRTRGYGEEWKTRTVGKVPWSKKPCICVALTLTLL